MESKELKIRPHKAGPMMYEVYYEGGGELPRELSGLFTSPSFAQREIDLYKIRRSHSTKKVAKKKVEDKSEG